MKTFLIGIKNVLLWSYERGSWQYDLLCLLIVTAVFLVPSSFFGDRDRGQAQTGVSDNRQPPSEGVREEVIDSGKLRGFLETRGRSAVAVGYPDEAIVVFLHDRCRCEVALVRPPEVMSDSQGRAGYRVWFKEK